MYRKSESVDSLFYLVQGCNLILKFVLQLVRMADKIFILKRLDVTATDVKLLRGNIKKGPLLR